MARRDAIGPLWAAPPTDRDRRPMDSKIVEELATRLPKTELAQIIKGMLECGKRNIVVGEADLIRAITFGANAVFGKAVPAQEQRVSTITQTRRRDTGEAVAP